MLLEDKFPDIKLLHDDGESFEIWWFYDTSILAVCHSPNNYPATVVHTMSLRQSTVEISKLLTEGWNLEKCSEKFLEFWKDNDKRYLGI
jgi:hypothetical protein